MPTSEMHNLKQPSSFYRSTISQRDNYHVKQSDKIRENIPLCIHAHTVIMPLLADYPNNRIDVNPFKRECPILSDYDWRVKSVNVAKALSEARKTNRCESVIVALDSFTIGNAKPTEFNNIDSDLILLVGDTQHGPAEGFIELIKLAQSGVFSKIITANNPQHLNLFRAYGVPAEKLFFCPLGLSNLPPWLNTSSNNNIILPTDVQNSLSESPYFIGSLTDHHPSRRKIINSLAKMGLTKVAKTRSYKEASYYHKHSLASINISLNSDINFRFSEVILSGGTLVTDLLPSIQLQYIRKFFGSKGIYYFKSFDHLKSLLIDIKRESSAKSFLDSLDLDSRFLSLWNDQKLLRTIDDLDQYLIAYSDDWREQAEKHVLSKYSNSVKSIGTWDRIYRYVEVRDFCRSQDSVMTRKKLIVHDQMCPLTLIDSADLQFDEIAIETKDPALNYVTDLISRHELNFFAAPS
jgi:hypothetical protein